MKTRTRRVHACSAITVLLCWSCVADWPRDPNVLLNELAGRGVVVDAQLGGGRVRYLGFEYGGGTLGPGANRAVHHYWTAQRKIIGDYEVFVHVLVQGARGWVAHGDHSPAPVTSRWPVGKVMRTTQRLRLPAEIPADRVELRVGLFKGKLRMPVDDTSHNDGTQRIRAGVIPVAGIAVPLPVYRAPLLARPPEIDGVVEAQEWSGVPWTRDFVKSRGDSPPKWRTRAKLAWHGQTLFVAMEAEDPDILATHQSRDDPIYRLESLEMFLDPEGDQQRYAELQVSPAGVQFDAAFRGGPRQNMQTKFNAHFDSQVRVDGTLEKPRGPATDTDRRWVTEWAVHVGSIPGAGALREGVRWRMNLCRIGKDRDTQGRLKSEESAWSAPLMGDLHNLERFGELWFVDGRTYGSSEPGAGAVDGESRRDP